MRCGLESWHTAITPGGWGQPQQSVIHGGRDHEDLSEREDSEQFILAPTNMCFGVKELPKFRSMVEAGEGGGVG